MKFRLPLFALLAFLLGACSDDATAPDTNGNNGGNGGKGFAIVSVDNDTVYWGDRVTVTLKDASTSSLTVFLHTTALLADSIWRDSSGNAGVRFRVPEGAVSGKLTVYAHDTIKASGERMLTVISQTPNELRPMIDTVRFSPAYVGDYMTIVGEDFPMARKDIDVTVNGVPFEIVSWDSAHIRVRVTPQVQPGDLHVRLFDSIHKPIRFETLEHTSEFLTSMPQKFIAGSYGKLIRTNREVMYHVGDSTVTVSKDTAAKRAGLRFDFDTLSVTESGDSIILRFSGPVGGTGNTVGEVRLKLEPDNRLSGVIQVHNYYRTYESYIEMHLNHVRWMKSKTSEIRYIRVLAHEWSDQVMWKYWSGSKDHELFYVFDEALVDGYFTLSFH